MFTQRLGVKRLVAGAAAKKAKNAAQHLDIRKWEVQQKLATEAVQWTQRCGGRISGRDMQRSSYRTSGKGN